MFLRSIFRRGPSLSNPVPPPGVGTVLHGNLKPAKVFLNHGQFFIIYFGMFCSAFIGNRFYVNFVMKKNPHNPPRWAEEKAPAVHMHAPEDDDDDDE